MSGSITTAATGTVNGTGAGTGTTPASSGTGANSLSSLAGNFNNFLSLLMTQLQNQDPTAPMDTNQFTSQLVQFTSVEQQINTNTSLTTLIQATQGNTLLQSSSLVGKQVEYSGNQLSLQNGTAGVKFTTPSAEQVNVTITSPTGAVVRTATVQSAAGSNSFMWDGTNAQGRTLPDGTYTVAVQGTDGSTVPFSLLGTATSVQRTTDNALKVQLGGLAVDFSTVQSVGAQQ